MKNRRARKPKTRLIAPELIADHLPRTKEGEIDWHAEIRVAYPDGLNSAMTVSPWELLELANQRIVCGSLTRGQMRDRASGKTVEQEYLTKTVLIASVHAAWRIVRGLRRPVMRADYISRAHQSPGAKRWVKRYDKAKPGHAGSVIQLAFPESGQIYDPTLEPESGDGRTGRRRMDRVGLVPTADARPAPKAA